MYGILMHYTFTLIGLALGKIVFDYSQLQAHNLKKCLCYVTHGTLRTRLYGVEASSFMFMTILQDFLNDW